LIWEPSTDASDEERIAMLTLVKSNPTAALTAVGLVTLGAGLVLGLWAGGSLFSAAPALPGESDPVYAREQLNEMLMGKTPAEVLQALGKPEKTSEDPEAVYWHYRGRTRDPITNRIDADVQLVFRKGTLQDINY